MSLKRACRAWALDCYFAKGRHTHSPVSGSRNWLVQRNHRPQRAQGPMSRLLHMINKKTKTAQARRRREVAARSGGGQTRGAPRPQHCAGASVKAQRNPRDRGDRVRPERSGECAERQREPQSPGSAGGKGQSTGGAACRDATQQLDPRSEPDCPPHLQQQFFFLKKKHCKWKMLLCQGMVPHI